MSYSSKKITNSERDAKHVQAADDVLIGNAEDNKAVFDQLPELIVERHNELIDELDTPASTTHYGPTTLSSSVTSTSESMAATPKAVKTVYDLASQASVSAVEIKQKVLGTDTEDYVSAGNPALIGNYEFGTLGYVEAEDVHTGAQPIGVYFYVSDESINPLNTGYRLADGGIILVKFGADVRNNAVLDIYEEPHCATGNIPIYYNGSPITTGIISEDDIIALSYDSANNRWHAINRVYTDFVGGYSAAGNKAGLVPQPPAIAETGEYSILTSDGWLSAFPLQDNRIPWARKYSPALTGTPTAPTATSGTDNTQIATTAFVQNAVSSVVTAETDPVFTASAAHGITSSDISAWNDKQDELVAGSNITLTPDSINGTVTIAATDTTYSDFTGATGHAAGTHGLVPAPRTTDDTNLLMGNGSFDQIDIGLEPDAGETDAEFALHASGVQIGDGLYVGEEITPWLREATTTTKGVMSASDKTKLNGIVSGAEPNVQSDWNESDSTADDFIKNKPTIPTKTSDLTNDSGFITSYTETDPVFSASAAHGISSSDISNWNGKQNELVSGTNIKTINNTSLLGSGNIDIQGGGGTYTATSPIDITNGVISHEDSGVTAGTYDGGATKTGIAVPSFTVDAKGHITAASDLGMTIPLIGSSDIVNLGYAGLLTALQWAYGLRSTYYYTLSAGETSTTITLTGDINSAYGYINNYRVVDVQAFADVGCVPVIVDWYTDYAGASATGTLNLYVSIAEAYTEDIRIYPILTLGQRAM